MHNRMKFFGQISNRNVEYSEIGLVTKQCWDVIPEHFPDSEIDMFVIMQNQIHRIVYNDGKS